jgi:protein TonB
MNALSPISLADAIEWQKAPVRRSDRWPVAVSTALHGTLIAIALVLLHPAPETFDIAGSSVEVELIAAETVSSNESATQSDAAMDMVSAGGEMVTPTVSETVEAIEPVMETAVEPEVQPALTEVVKAQAAEAVEAVTAEAQDISPTETAEPVEAGETAPLLAATAETVSPEDMTVAPVEAMETPVAEALEPVEAPAEDAPPVPQPRTTKQKPKEAETPAKKPPAKAAPKKPQLAGNGGNSNADAKASAPAGGQKPTGQPGNGAAVTKYPGQVLAKLRRALRYPSGGRGTGEVSVQFTVAAAGQASGVRVVKSSGNPVFDKAALATVQRAAPFPPIPPEAGRSSWTFTMPLGFVR